MKLNKSIGGFFELELNESGSMYHDNAIRLNSGRNALEYILSSCNYNKIYLPYYICDVVLQPIKRQNIDYEFYYIDENFNPILEGIKKTEVILYVNYFGIFNHMLDKIKDKYKNVIIDNAQAFFSKPLVETSAIYSPRKFFGVPDGGFVYSNFGFKLKLENDTSAKRVSHLVSRIEEGPENTYISYTASEKLFDDISLKYMSLFTSRILKSIDYEKIRKRRNSNFEILHQALKNNNNLSSVIEKESIDGPLVYPFLKDNNFQLREFLISNKIYVAKYWNNVNDWVIEKDKFEIFISQNLLPLPIDQRYNEEDMKKITSLITEFLNSK